MNKIIIPTASVELTLENGIENTCEFREDFDPRSNFLPQTKPSRVSIRCYSHLKDIKINLPDGRAITLFNVTLRELKGELHPHHDVENNEMCLFTLEENIKPDHIVEKQRD